MISGSSSLDTSVLIRLLVGEPKAQHESALRFLQEQKGAKRPVHVSDLVLSEAYFALQSYYGIPKHDALAMLALFLNEGSVSATPTAKAVLALPNLPVPNRASWTA